MKIMLNLGLFLLFAVSLNSQELNEDYLNSLPDDIKKDLMDKNAKQELSLIHITEPTRQP